jgi:hypothetical protein
MRTFMLSALLILLIIPSLSFGTPPPVAATYQPVEGGYRYYLSVHNYLSPEWGNIVIIDAYPLFGASGLEAPPLWNTGYNSWQVHWETDLGGHDWQDGIPPGQSLSGFSVVVPEILTSFTYHLMWYSGTDGTAAWGDVYPTPIPEPSSLLALCGGLMGLGGLVLRRRRKYR